jgi:misacylated tRNA(Ala) deacylase
MASHVGLYLSDPYARSFEARVLDVDGDRVALDRTAFCPGELGQMPDRGWLRWGAKDKANVADVRTDAGVFWHRVDGAPPPVGTTITGELDWAYRLRMMRTHTAFHLVSALTFHLCGAQALKSQVVPNGLQLSFKSDCWSPLLPADIERRANQAIAADIPVYTYFLSREEARETPFINRLKVDLLPPHVRNVRVVEIEGIALDIDTGTHIRSTREIGSIQVTRAKAVDARYQQLELRILARASSKTHKPVAAGALTKDKGQPPFAI